MKIYEIDGFDSLVYGVSLVEDPAIEESYIALSKQKPAEVVTLEAEDRHLVVGPCLIPGQLIYRRDDYTGEEYYLRFSAEAIAQLSRKFLSERYVTIDHEREARGAYVSESWLKADMEKDKSVALGLNPDLPVGTWFLSTYIDSNELWEEVKDGRWTGYSIEAFVNVAEAEFRSQERKDENKENKEMKKNFLERLMALFGEMLSDEENVGEQELEQCEKPEPEAEPQAEEAESVSEDEAPVAEEPEAEEPEEEQPADEEPAEEEPEAEPQAEGLEARVAELENALTDALNKLAEANEKVQQLSKQPSAKPVNVKASSEGGSVIDVISALRDGTYFKS